MLRILSSSIRLQAQSSWYSRRLPRGTTTGCSAQATPRQYHSAAVLLPDGSVFVAGGQFPGASTEDQHTYQIFKPPYFFQGSRPTITSVPATIIFNKAFYLDTPDAAQVTKVRLIRLGAATHSFDQNQRSLELTFTVADADTLRVAPPKHGFEAPPGHYMLFIATGTNGSLPSIGTIVQLSPLSSIPPG